MKPPFILILWYKKYKIITAKKGFPAVIFTSFGQELSLSILAFNLEHSVKTSQDYQISTPPFRLSLKTFNRINPWLKRKELNCTKKRTNEKENMVTPVKKVPIHLQSAQNRLLIKNGTVVNDDGQESIDVYIEDSRIKQMGSHLIIPGGTRVIDATGKFILPGGIDANVHLEAPYLVNTEVCICHSTNFFSLY